MWMRLTRTSATQLRKQPKRLSHTSIEVIIFRVGMQSVNPSIKPFCSLLRDSSLAATALLAKLDRKRRDRWFEAVQSIDFSHSSRKAWTLSNLTGRSRHSPITVPFQPMLLHLSWLEMGNTRLLIASHLDLSVKKCLTFGGHNTKRSKYL